MKQLLREARCKADFPDDTIWDEAGEHIVQTGGLNMANAVADLLRANGAEVFGPDDHLEHGWEMEAVWHGGKFWLQVTLVDRSAYILTQDYTYGLFSRLLGRKSPYTAFLEMLHDRLATGDRYGDIRWYPYPYV